MLLPVFMVAACRTAAEPAAAAAGRRQHDVRLGGDEGSTGRKGEGTAFFSVYLDLCRTPVEVMSSAVCMHVRVDEGEHMQRSVGLLSTPLGRKRLLLGQAESKLDFGTLH